MHARAGAFDVAPLKCALLRTAFTFIIAIVMNRFVVWRAAGQFESVFKFDVGFPVSRLSLDFSVTLSIY
jgi:hypothetical protein